MKKKAIFLVLIIIIGISCRDKDRSSLLPNVTGKSGEVVLVIDNELWSSKVGDEFKKYLASDYPGLPQPEPLFDLVQIPYQAFSNIFKTHRNLLIVRVSNEFKEARMILQKDVYASPQLVINILAPNNEVLEKLISEKGDLIVDRLLKMETTRYEKSYFKYKEKKVSEQIAKKFGIKLDFPIGYSVDLDTTDFVWIANDSPTMSQGVLIFSYKKPDVQLTTPYLIAKRNEFTKRFVSGANAGSYMTVEPEMEPFRREIEVNGLKVVELRSLWRVEGDFMGGPFVTFIIQDTKNDRIIHLDGFVYAPQFDKRGYVRQLEAILSSVKFI
ncbi:MAG: DUF4837 family protein [Bacteroidales bacterium]